MSDAGYSLKIDNNIAILSVSGSLTSQEVVAFDDHLEKAMEQSDKIILDFAALEYMCSAAIGTLISYFNQTSEHGGTVIVAGVNSKMQKVLDVIGFPSIVEIVPSVAAAKKIIFDEDSSD
jgi:anti-anti-sigma factor